MKKVCLAAGMKGEVVTIFEISKMHGGGNISFESLAFCVRKSETTRVMELTRGDHTNPRLAFKCDDGRFFLLEGVSTEIVITTIIS